MTSRIDDIADRVAGDAGTPTKKEEESHGRVRPGTLGLHERAQEVLAAPDRRRPCAVRDVDRAHARIGGGALPLHLVLIGNHGTRAMGRPGAPGSGGCTCSRVTSWP